MDSLFEILIMLFLIYSVVSSIFAARKKSESSDEGEENSSPESSPDLLEDLFGIKTPQQTQNENTISWNPEKEFDNYKESVKTAQTKIETEFKSPVKKVNEAYQKKKVRTKADSIRMKMKNPQTLRELYLISEILNKPKAFRR
ncbi:hypothetical protein MROS_2466 [Melioribacter roseus P3M-2]|uniref:Uncharacterized protein n=1 Tax=Melioribacter roseus (strain DSM 23840 / JCM 17771 / VKM B-2668 / P3M-2) TaxID=1191523 RepID=I7A733_MELRP|nr:hypothetical protein [Melioribacter roseus]AFN75696.1 hypothetical protein MROS_2466 [Melioribacter roseus P3M-2]